MTVGGDQQRLIAALINVAVADRPGARVITLRVGQGDASQGRMVSGENGVRNHSFENCATAFPSHSSEPYGRPSKWFLTPFSPKMVPDPISPLSSFITFH